MTKSLAEKISLAADLLATIQRLSDIIFIDDNGCIINQDGEFAEWFSKTIESEKIKDKFSVCIISRYRLRTFSGEISYSTKEKIEIITPVNAASLYALRTRSYFLAP